MLLDLQTMVETERDFTIMESFMRTRPARQLNPEESEAIVEDLKWHLAKRRPTKKFKRVQRRDATEGLELKRRQVEALPILPESVRRPPATLMGMNWAKTGEHWPDVEYEKDKSPLGLLLDSAARHNMRMLKDACFSIKGTCPRIGIDLIQEAQSEAFIAYSRRGYDVDRDPASWILTGIKGHFLNAVKVGRERKQNYDNVIKPAMQESIRFYLAHENNLQKFSA